MSVIRRLSAQVRRNALRYSALPAEVQLTQAFAVPGSVPLKRQTQRGGRCSTETVTVVMRSLRTTMSQIGTGAPAKPRPRAFACRPVRAARRCPF